MHTAADVQMKADPFPGTVFHKGVSVGASFFAMQTVSRNTPLTGASARKDGHYEREEVHSASQWHKG